DFENEVIYVNQNLTELNGEPILSETKTEESKREIPMLATVKAILERHRTEQALEQQAARDHWQDADFVFATTLILSGKAQPHLRPHNLRHTAATLMMRVGMPIAVVSKILGHARISITTDVYRQVRLEEKRTKMIDLFAGKKLAKSSSKFYCSLFARKMA
ncbi:MAG: hypothetical protein RLZZ156_2950, partial [Deinococcota bacterium]